MKRISCLFLTSIILLSACKDNPDYKIWDIAPVVVAVSVVDPQGNDLLNPINSNAFELSSIKAIYKDKEYVCDIAADRKGDSKAYMPHFYGLLTYFNERLGSQILNFGEFDGAKSYKDESIKLVWPDGSSDVIRYNRVFKWKANGDPSVQQEWFLNNSKVADGVIKIVK